MTAATSFPFDAPSDETDEIPHDIDAEKYLLAAMMMSDDAVDGAARASLRPGDFYRPVHQDIATALIAMFMADIKRDPVTVREWMGEQAFKGPTGPAYLHDIYSVPALGPSAPTYATRVHELAVRRRCIEAGIRLIARGRNPGGLSIAALLAMAEDEIAAATGALDAVDDSDDPRTLANDVQAVAHRWIVPGMLAEMDRLLIVGGEGDGKSALLFQIAMAIAAGRHPFMPHSIAIEPKRTLLIDLEVGRAMMARRSRWMIEHADANAWDPQMMRIVSRPSGVDLRGADGQMWLTQHIRRHRPHLICAGPMYKMGLNKAEKITEHTLVAEYIDRIREQYGCAWVLEQHAPLAQGGQRRLLRPKDAAIWTEWPEFGFALKPRPRKEGPNRFDLYRFRKDREQRVWPETVSWRQVLSHGWPWEASMPEGWNDVPVTGEMAGAYNVVDLSSRRESND